MGGSVSRGWTKRRASVAAQVQVKRSKCRKWTRTVGVRAERKRSSVRGSTPSSGSMGVALSPSSSSSTMLDSSLVALAARWR